MAQWDGRQVGLTEMTPASFGLEPVSVEALRGGDANDNAAIIRDVLSGTIGAPRTAVLINAAASLCVAGSETEPSVAAARAADAIDSGDARRTLERWVEFTQAS